MTLEQLVQKRKDLWNQSNSDEVDREYRNAVADWLMELNTTEKKLIFERIIERPSWLIQLFYTVVDKEMKTVPFFLNDAQQELDNIIFQGIKDFNEGKRNYQKYIVLKGRQQGFTTYITALQLAMAITRKNFHGMTLADIAENTESIFQDKAKFAFDALPESIKPSIKFSNKQEFNFAKKSGGGLNSRWRVTSAENKKAGRSKTLNFFHGSEAAFWTDSKTLLIGLEEALTRACLTILETTANGMNYFKQLYDNNNNWTSLFFEWWITKEYKLNFVSDQSRIEFMSKVDAAIESEDPTSEQWAYFRCKWLLEEKNLSPEQIYWYYSKWTDKGESMKQEYPCTPEEAFLASGRTYFSLEMVYSWLQKLKAKENVVIRRGTYTYEYGMNTRTNNKIIIENSIKWVDDPNGPVYIYEKVDKGRKYSLGGDTATDGSDRNIAFVVDKKGKTHAKIAVETDETLFGDLCTCLGREYNWALAALEVNHSTHPTKVMQEREYKNLYVRETDEVSFGKALSTKYGFRTMQGNRSDMLGNVRDIIREDITVIQDAELLQEMMVFIVNDKGKAVAESGEHDDHVMAYAIACYIYNQIADFHFAEEEYLNGTYTDTELQDLGYSKYEISRYKQGYGIVKKRSDLI